MFRASRQWAPQKHPARYWFVSMTVPIVHIPFRTRCFGGASDSWPSLSGSLRFVNASIVCVSKQNPSSSGEGETCKLHACRLGTSSFLCPSPRVCASIFSAHLYSPSSNNVWYRFFNKQALFASRCPGKFSLMFTCQADSNSQHDPRHHDYDTPTNNARPNNKHH